MFSRDNNRITPAGKSGKLKRICSALLCLILLTTIFLPTTVFAAESTDNANEPADLGTFAGEIYRTILGICIPIAIVSFASCGWTFLGTIFFGTYNAPSATQKAQTRLVWTIVGVMFLVFLPTIFDAAKAVFSSSAWTPDT